MPSEGIEARRGYCGHLMPVKDSIAACREIAASLPETRVLTLTASNKRGTIVDAVNAGATRYLQKYSG